MSGIAGIVNLDGAPVDRDLLWSMTQSLGGHGPDAQEIWVDRNIGLGHALLRTTPESATEHQPATLDGSSWIAADCRVDARDDLRRELAARGHLPAQDAADAVLILHAYAAWGEQCVDHLLGDFTFAIWDVERRTLVCARDHLGIKPFFYVHDARTVVFSNSLNAVRLHPAVSDRLDDLAIADFLVFGHPLDTDRSSFSAIRRLSPGHVLHVSDNHVTPRRYWTMPLEDELHYPRRSEYLEQFRSLLSEATKDRLRTTDVSVMMSGGLDSPAIAATAHRLLRADGRPFDLRAHTIVFDRIVPDEERKYSRIAAEAIGIPVRHHPFDDFGFPPPEPAPAGYPPEPRMLFDWSRTIAVHRPAANDARVILRGEGADPLFLATTSAPQRLIDEGQYWRVASEYGWLVWKRRQLPYFGVRTMFRRALGRSATIPVQPFPAWLSPELEEKYQLRDRWRAQAFEDSRPGLELTHGFWSSLFESVDPVSMQMPAEMRYPFLDLRLVRWALRVPQVPWAMEKSLLRLSMKGLLPARILRRRKAPLAGNPWAALLPPANVAWWEPYMQPAPELPAFVDVETAAATLARVLQRSQATNAHADIDLLRSSLRPLSLNLWLDRVARGNLRTRRSSSAKVQS